MKKVFRALKAHVCEKRFVGDKEATPEGWHATTVDALAAWEPEVEPDGVGPDEAADRIDAPPVDAAPVFEDAEEADERVSFGGVVRGIFAKDGSAE